MPDRDLPSLPSDLESAALHAIFGPAELLDERVTVLCRANPRRAEDIREFVHRLVTEADASSAFPATLAVSSMLELEQLIGARPGVRLPPADDDSSPAPSAGAQGHAGDLPGPPAPGPGTGTGPEPGPQPGRYRRFEKLGQGGIGVVYRGEDSDLGRTVAMKFLHERYSRQAPIVLRFVEEAQIGAQLQHPGIVPVYDLGLADGRPFFAMKLVRGKTLSLRLRERASPRAELQRWLTVFEQVCRTIAYAHVRGVVHRDLKPDNILIGSYGEVQVVDWGMGKVLGGDGGSGPAGSAATGAADVSGAAAAAGWFGDQSNPAQHLDEDVATVRSADRDTASIPGSLLGTPSYMAPEQATGEVEAVDRRTDVFALGAILCEILTGLPPYVAGDPDLTGGGAPSPTTPTPTSSPTPPPAPPTPQDRILRAAAGAALAPARARLAASGAEPALLAICADCLAERAADRPAHAGRVADAVADYLSSVEARAEAARLQVLTARQRQRWLAVVAATVVVGLGVALYFWSSASALAVEKGRLAAAERSARDEAQRLARETETARQKAQDHLDRFTELKNLVLLEDARIAERELYPPWPSRSVALESWLETHGRPLIAAIGPIERTLRQVEARARLESPGATPDPASAALASRHRHARARLDELERAALVRRGQPPAELRPGLDPELRTRPLAQLRALIHPRVSLDPAERKVIGEGALALAVARLLVERSAVEEPARTAVDTYFLALALHHVGHDQEARATSTAAIDRAPGSSRRLLQVLDQDLQNAIAAVAGAAGERRRRDLAAEIERLGSELERTRRWTFANAEDTFLHPTLTNLRRDLERFARVTFRGVERRAAWAAQLVERCHDRHARAWREAAAALAMADGQTAAIRYASTPRLALVPQAGLVPIGKNPKTGLWEFYHLASAADPDAPPPRHDPRTGDVVVGADTGIVFVLIPGGTRWLGAQHGDPAAPNFEPGALPDETPFRVALAPFFIARHELTQGQWLRLTAGANPSQHAPPYKSVDMRAPIDLRHPVEMVDWSTARDLLVGFGLNLPSEAQWEYACRAGTATGFHCGDDAGALEGFENIFDRTAAAVMPEWDEHPAPFDDGWIVHAPVGALRANAFGLHDVHGNVREWCLDRFAEYRSATPQPGDGRREPPTVGLRVTRGGSFAYGPAVARAAMRGVQAEDFSKGDLGLRAVRALSPEDFRTPGRGR